MFWEFRQDGWRDCFSRPTLGRHQRPDHGFFPRPLETWQKRRQVQTMDKTVYDSSGPFRYFMFWPTFHLEGIALHAWVAFAYVFYGMSYTGTSMPFGAMASVVSTDPIDRSKLSRARSIGGTVVGIGALSVVPILCFDKDSNIIPERFGLIAVIFGILCSYFLPSVM